MSILPNGIKRHNVQDVLDGRIGPNVPGGLWLWTECGDGQLEPVRYVRPDCWVVCGHGTWLDAQRSYCCHGGDYLYSYSTDAARERHESNLRGFLRDKRVQLGAAHLYGIAVSS